MIEATELEHWSSLGNLGRVAAALAAGADVNAPGAGGYTAMHAAAENGHAEVVRLLDWGAAVDPRTDGRTPLDLGVGHPEVVAALLAAGATRPNPGTDGAG